VPLCSKRPGLSLRWGVRAKTRRDQDLCAHRLGVGILGSVAIYPTHDRMVVLDASHPCSKDTKRQDLDFAVAKGCRRGARAHTVYEFIEMSGAAHARQLAYATEKIGTRRRWTAILGEAANIRFADIP